MTPTTKAQPASTREPHTIDSAVAQSALDSLACALSHLGEAYRVLAEAGHTNTYARSDIHTAIGYTISADNLIREEVSSVGTRRNKG